MGPALLISGFTVGIRLVACVPSSRAAMLPTALKQPELSGEGPNPRSQGGPGQPLVVPASWYYTCMYVCVYICICAMSIINNILPNICI